MDVTIIEKMKTIQGMHCYLPMLSGEIDVVNCMVVTEKDLFFGNAHAHQFSELIIGLAGVTMYRVNGENMEIREGTGLFIQKGVPHEKVFIGNTSGSVLVIHLDYLISDKTKNSFKEYVLDEMLIIKNLTEKNVQTFKINENCAAELGGLAIYSSAGNIGDFIKTRNILTHIILSCAQSAYKVKDNAHHLELYGKYQNQNKIFEVNSYITDHISEELTVEEVANYLHYTPRHLQRLILEFYDTSFAKLVIAFRIAYVQKLLVTTDLKNQEISIQSGFGSVKVMQKHFKTITGMTLTEYRNKMKWEK